MAVSSRTMSLSRYGRLKFVRSAKSVSSFSFKHFRCHLSSLVLQMCCSRQADVLEARARSGREVGSQFCSVSAGLLLFSWNQKLVKKCLKIRVKFLQLSQRLLVWGSPFASQLEMRSQCFCVSFFSIRLGSCWTFPGVAVLLLASFRLVPGALLLWLPRFGESFCLAGYGS